MEERQFSDALDGSESDHTVGSWSTDIETILTNLLENVNELQREHKTKFIMLQSQLIYFRVPLIILSSLNSVFSVGLSAYVEQQIVSTINCLISLTCACISSVELFLNIHKNMEITVSSYHGYKLLGIKISSCLKLDREHRDKNAQGFMHDCIADYRSLLEQSVVLIKDLDDRLLNYKAPVQNRLLVISPRNA